MKFLIDTGAELCLCKYSSVKECTVYNSKKIINVKGISDSVEKTSEEVDIRLCTAVHETDHPFQIVGDGIDIPCDGILGKDFFETEKAKIDCSLRQVIMGNIRANFDKDRELNEQVDTVYAILNPRSETIVKVVDRFSRIKNRINK
jgi:hypothetical protein